VKQKLHLRYSFCDNGTIFVAEILHVISFISSEINIFTLPKHSKRSFALIFSSLTLCTERFIQRLPKTVTSAHSCAQGIIDHKKYLKINEGLVWSPLDSMDPRMTLEEQNPWCKKWFVLCCRIAVFRQNCYALMTRKALRNCLPSDYSVFFTISRRAFGWVVYVKWPDVSERDRKMGKLGLSPLE